MKFKCPSCGAVKREYILTTAATRMFFTDEELSNDEVIDNLECSSCHRSKITQKEV